MWKSKAHIGSLYGPIRIIYGQFGKNMETIYMGTYLWTRLCTMWKSKGHIGSLYGPLRIIHGQSKQNMETIYTWAHIYGLDYALCGNQKDILGVCMDH